MDVLAAEIKQKLREHLFAHTMKVIFFTLVFSLIIIIYINLTGTPISAIYWLISLSCIVILRTVIARTALRSSEHISFYYILFIVSGLLLGSLLGYFYWSVYYDINSSQRLILLLFFAGLAAGSTITMAASPLSFMTLILPVYIPTFITNMLDSNLDAKFIALMIFMYLAFIFMVFYTNNKMLKDNIRLILQHEELNQKLSLISATDELTNLANRRYFQERLAHDWLQAKVSQSPISLVIIDIDYFKECNDHYGHLYGDTCLRTIGHTIAKQIRKKSDLAARYGGDELVVILNNINLQQTKEVVSKLYQAIINLSIKNEHSPISNFVTVTIGAANMIPNDADVTALFNKADKILYEAKLKGKNRFIVS